MTRQLGPRMVHLTDQALAALDQVTWASTSEVITAIGCTPADAQSVWRALNWLARQGLAERIHVADSRAVYWRRLTPPPELDETAHQPRERKEPT